MPPRSTPTSARAAVHGALYAGIARDLCYVAAGLLGLVGVPPSVDVLGVTGGAAWLWASCFIFGGALMIYGGIVTRGTAQTFGSLAVAVGLGVWAYAAVRQPEATSVTYMLVLVFGASVFARVEHALLASTGIFAFAVEAVRPATTEETDG